VSRLDEIKARADAATEGPWVRDMHSPDMSGRSGWYIRGPRKLGLRSMVLNSRMLPGDAEFIEASREDVPWLVDQVESLERWKVEALEVMSGLRELGKALGLGLGVQITGPAALTEVARLTAEREWFNDRFPCDGVCVDAPEEACSRHGRNPADLWQIIGEVAAERNALAAAHARESEKVWKVEEVMDDIEGSDPTTWERLRDALAGSEADHDMPTENWTCPRCNRERPAQVWVCDCVPSPQSTDPGCGCSTNPARARYADGDPAGCYCTCSDDAREGCEHEPDEPQPTDLEVK